MLSVVLCANDVLQKSNILCHFTTNKAVLAASCCGIPCSRSGESCQSGWKMDGDKSREIVFLGMHKTEAEASFLASKQW